MRAVRFDEYGGVDRLYVADIPTPEPGPGEVVVEVRAAGLNPGETMIREGLLHERWPASFPSGQGTDFAGVVTAIGAGVSTVEVGAEVAGWSEWRSSQAQFVRVPANQVTPKPSGVPWEVAGALYVAGGAAWAGLVATEPQAGETVVISGASGGVGLLSVQLVRERGADVVALSSAANRAFLEELGATWVDYAPGDNLARRLHDQLGKAPDAWIDDFGAGYVDIAVELGVPPTRINTIIDFAAVEKHGVQAVGTHDVTDAAVLAGLLERAADGRIVLPIAATYPLEQVRDAVGVLEQRRTRGKIVLIP
jgi:NADPH:quinone reductase-like Zn-dependent oxidoreductase